MVEGRLENTVAWTEEDFGKLSLKDVIANIVKTNERRASSEWNNKRANWNDAFSREVQETIIYELAMLTDGRRVAIFDGTHDEADVWTSIQKVIQARQAKKATQGSTQREQLTIAANAIAKACAEDTTYVLEGGILEPARLREICEKEIQGRGL
jgi:hypothetical protein